MGLISKTLDLGLSQVPSPAVENLMGASGSTYVLRLCTFHELTCHKTEDWTGADETQLRIWIDDALSNVDEGTLLQLRDFLGTVGSALQMMISLPTSAGAYVFRRDMNDGHRASLGLTVPLLPGRRVRLHLQDLDGGFADPHDTLGDMSTTVRPAPYGDALDADGAPGRADGDIDFTGDDAHYSLTYRITEVLLKEPVADGPTGPGGIRLPRPIRIPPLPGGGGDLPDVPDTPDVPDVPDLPDLPLVGGLLGGASAPTQPIRVRTLPPVWGRVVVPDVRTKVR